MSGPRVIVHFVCPSCHLPYRATEEQRSEQLSGSFECVKCRTPVHKWTGFYDLFNWQAVRMEPVAPRDKI